MEEAARRSVDAPTTIALLSRRRRSRDDDRRRATDTHLTDARVRLFRLVVRSHLGRRSHDDLRDSLVRGRPVEADRSIDRSIEAVGRSAVKYRLRAASLRDYRRSTCPASFRTDVPSRAVKTTDARSHAVMSDVLSFSPSDTRFHFSTPPLSAVSYLHTRS